MREADQIPEYFERDGQFDIEACERFFAARNEIICDYGTPQPAPLIPISKHSLFVQERWRQYLVEKAERIKASCRPMNGELPAIGRDGLGKGGLYGRLAGVKPATALAATSEAVSRPLAHRDAALNDGGFDNGRDHPASEIKAPEPSFEIGEEFKASEEIKPEFKPEPLEIKQDALNSKRGGARPGAGRPKKDLH